VSVWWRPGLSGAPIDSSLPKGHHNSKNPRFLNITFNTRALAFTPRHNSKNQSLSKSQIHRKHLGTCERVISYSFELLLLGLPFFFSHSYSQVLCKRCKRHQVCGGPCGVLVVQARFAIIHRTVRCATGLSGVTAEQRLLHATVDYKSAVIR
jgi:hypothetical protein